jgi:hypothetical protein
MAGFMVQPSVVNRIFFSLPTLLIIPMELPEELKQIAFDELGETPEIREATLVELRRRILELPEQDRIEDLRDANLIRYLRGRKFNVDKAVKTIVQYKQFCTAHPAWVKDFTEEEVVCMKSVFNVLERRTVNGQRIIFIQFRNLLKVFTKEFLQKYPYARVRTNVWLLEELSKEVHVQVCGVVLIGYFEGFSFWDNITFSQLVPLEQHTGMFQFLNNCCGLRIAGIYLLHEPAFAHFLFSITRMFLSEKLRSRFHLCGSNYAPLYEAIPDRTVLPVSLGGAVNEEDYCWIEAQFASSHQ